MNIYEIQITDKHRSSLSAILFDQFVVLAEDFNEAKKKADKYLKNMDVKDEKSSLVIKSIDQKYVIKQGL